MISQFTVGVELLVAAVTFVLIVSWEVNVLYVAQRLILWGWNLSTALALEFSLWCCPRHTFHVLVQVSHQLWPSRSPSFASQFCVLQYSQNFGSSKKDLKLHLCFCVKESTKLLAKSKGIILSDHRINANLAIKLSWLYFSGFLLQNYPKS